MFSISRALVARVRAFNWRQVADRSVARQTLLLALAVRFLKALALVFLILFMTRSAVSVAGALTTDDADLVGKDKWQLELTGESSSFITSRERVLTPELSYGISDNVQVSFTMPYQHLADDGEPWARGMNDPSLNLKWRLYEKNGLTFVFAPAVSLPTGDEEKGLGNGRATYRAVGVLQYETGAYTWLLNAGYIRNNNVEGDRRNLWNISGGMYYQLNPKTKLGIDYGYNSTNDPNITRFEHFAGLGAVYSPSEQVEFMIGYKRGFNQDSLDHAWKAGVVLHW